MSLIELSQELSDIIIEDDENSIKNIFIRPTSSNSSNNSNIQPSSPSSSRPSSKINIRIPSRPNSYNTTRNRDNNNNSNSNNNSSNNSNSNSTTNSGKNSRSNSGGALLSILDKQQQPKSLSILYQGRKYFYQSKSNTHIHIIQHLNFACLEIIVYETELLQEAPHIYISSLNIFSKISEEQLVQKVNMTKKILQKTRKIMPVNDILRLGTIAIAIAITITITITITIRCTKSISGRIYNI